VVFLPLRETGAKIWPEVSQEVKKNTQVKQLRKSLETATEEQKLAIQS
jgi:hypothetical protein